MRLSEEEREALREAVKACYALEEELVFPFGGFAPTVAKQNWATSIRSAVIAIEALLVRPDAAEEVAKEMQSVGYEAMRGKLIRLLKKWRQPCPGPCDHAHCPLLHELGALVRGTFSP